MTSIEMAIPIPERPSYGAIELKEFIRKNTWKAFFITLATILLLFLLYWFFTKPKPTFARIRRGTTKIEMLKATQEVEDQQESAASTPPDAILEMATAQKAGTPIPVQDVDIKIEFADVSKMIESAGRDTGQITQKFEDIKLNFDDKKTKFEGPVEKEEALMEFESVENDVVVDLGGIQKKVVYPEMARQAGIEGRVVVRVLITKDGKPTKPDVTYSDSDMLNKAAVDAIMKSSYQPALQNKVAVNRWIQIPVVFKLK